jgi:hypothetical protein
MRGQTVFVLEHTRSANIFSKPAAIRGAGAIAVKARQGERGSTMKPAIKTRVTVRVGVTSRVEELETSGSSFSFLASIWQKMLQAVRTGKRHKVPYAGGTAPQPASSCVMLVESDIRGGVRGILP